MFSIAEYKSFLPFFWMSHIIAPFPLWEIQPCLFLPRQKHTFCLRTCANLIFFVTTYKWLMRQNIFKDSKWKKKKTHKLKIHKEVSRKTFMKLRDVICCSRRGWLYQNISPTFKFPLVKTWGLIWLSLTVQCFSGKFLAAHFKEILWKTQAVECSCWKKVLWPSALT